MRLVVVETPYRVQGETHEERKRERARVLRYVRAALRDCLMRGEAPYASHALYTQPRVLDDDIPDQRAHGIEAGFAWGDLGHARVVYTDLGITSGMQLGIERAERLGQPIEYRTIPWDWMGAP